MKAKVWLERRWNGTYTLWGIKPREQDCHGLILFDPCEKLIKKYCGLKEHLKIDETIEGTMEFKFKQK